MPKKTIIALTAALLMLPTMAMASDRDNHKQDRANNINYTGPTANVTTVAENLKNVGRFSEIDVVLEGKLIHQVSGDKYMFQDDSGKILVELDDDIKLPTAIDHNTKLRIFGELEGGSTPKVDVDYIKLI